MPSGEMEFRRQLVECMASLVSQGLMTGTGGNASVRLKGGNEVLITPSGVYKASLKPEDIVKIDLEGNIVEGAHRPSIEWHFHTAIYRKRADAMAVLHAHSSYTTGLALAGRRIEPVTIEAAMVLGDVPIIEFMYPGTDELGDAVGNAMMDHKAAILLNHGVVTAGRDLAEAITIAEVLEATSKITFVASHFGGARLIPPDRIELIKKLNKV